MIIWTESVIFKCDECEKEETFDIVTAEDSYFGVGDFEKQLKKQGWEIDGERCLCPKCK